MPDGAIDAVLNELRILQRLRETWQNSPNRPPAKG